MHQDSGGGDARSTALLRSVRHGELDRIKLNERALDVLAQQIVAETAAEEWQTDDLFDFVRRSRPYRDLPREDFDAVVKMLADGYVTRRGRKPRQDKQTRDRFLPRILRQSLEPRLPGGCGQVRKQEILRDKREAEERAQTTH